MINEFQNILRLLRRKKGLTQKELAAFINVSFQTISKWENGVTTPDISYFPVLAKYFGVSTDILLGLEPLEQESAFRKFDRELYWEEQMERVKQWKFLFLNDDYLDFLVHRVWRITRPVSLLDFGCGYGYLGLMLLPLLPEGSTYTGIELSKVYIREGEKLFADTPYPHEFICADIYEYHPSAEYDIVISLMLFSYLLKPELLLDKMKSSVKENGLVIGIDINLEMEHAGIFTGLEVSDPPSENPDYKKIWKTELEKGERDYRMGTKLPYLFSRFGLNNIQARMSDRIFVWDSKNLASVPDKEEYKELFSKFRYVCLHDDPVRNGYAYYLQRGVNWSEIDYYMDYNKMLKQYLEKDNIFVARPSCLIITWGTK